MNRKLLPTLCCALLCTFAGLFLSSCAATPPPCITVSYGPTSLQRHQVAQTAEKYRAQRPTTLQQMSDLLGVPPQGTHTDTQGKYCRWLAYEESDKGSHQSAIAACLVNKSGVIEKSYLSYCPRPFEYKNGPGESVTDGDKDLQDSNVHPGMVQANLVPYREKVIKQGFAYGKEVAFSPTGISAVFLPHGAYVKEWAGETANICYPTPQQQAPAPQQTPAPQQPSTAKTLLDTANTAIKLIELFR